MINMCILYAIKIWLKLGGRFLITFQPHLHVMVVTANGRIFHGTTKCKSGKWHIEEIDSNAFARWLIYGKKATN